MRSRNGLVFHVPRSLCFIFKDIFLHRAYAPKPILRKIPTAPTVIDLGANAGYFSLFALHVRPQAKVLSFEPMPANYSLLQRNHSDHPSYSWRIFPDAVSNESGFSWLNSVDPLGPSTTASLQGGNQNCNGNRVKVATRTLPEIMERETTGVCDWLKVDVEGFEYDILYSLPSDQFRRIRTLCVEADPVDHGKRNRMALARFLDQMNFDVLLADDAVLYALNRKI